MLLVLAALVITGCDFVRIPTTIDDFEERIQVHSILTVGDTAVAVFITRTQRPMRVENEWGNTLFYSIPEPVEGAHVSLLVAGDSIQAVAGTAENPACRVETRFGIPPVDYLPACYRAGVPGGVRTGQSYELRIQLPDGGRVTGEAIVPEPPVILKPVSGNAFRERVEPILLRWEPLGDPTVHVHATRDECEVRLFGVARNQFGAAPYTRGTDSTAFTLQLTCPDTVEVPRPTPVDLIVTRYSEEYAEYLAFHGHELGSMAEEMASPGLTGAIGAFAGAAQDTVAIMLLEPEG